MEKVLIVGTIRNPDYRFKSNLKRVIQAIPKDYEVSTFVVESDSDPAGLSLLHEIKIEETDFKFSSLGNLSRTFPDRIERIRKSRNMYVEYIQINFSKIGWKYIVVADLDGMNAKISLQGIESSLRALSKFDGVFANQKHGYYDLYALRCEGWVDADPVLELYRGLDQLKPASYPRFVAKAVLRIQEFKMRTKVIYSRMLIIDKNQAPINVLSAFGGLGIYKTEIFLNCNYSRYDDRVRQSEHVDLHLNAISFGYRFAINPEMINSNWNTHNINRLAFIRIVRNSGSLKYMRKFFQLIQPNRRNKSPARHI